MCWGGGEGEGGEGSELECHRSFIVVAVVV